MATGSAGTRTRPALIGRRDELAELRGGLEDARARRGRLFLVAGEGGVGKTRLVEALVEETAPPEARAVWGRCWEGGGAGAYWPWVQVVQGALAGSSTDRLRQLGPVIDDVAQLVPELRERAPWIAPAPPSHSPDARLRLFDSVVTVLSEVAVDGGLVVALDDLHAADEASLRLLQHVAAALQGTSLLVVGTYRDAEVRSSPHLHRLLGAIARQGRRIVLSGLTEPEVAALLEHVAPDPLPTAVVRGVHYTTDGNPFFVQEVVRLLGRGVSAGAGFVPPEEIHAAIRRRLEGLAPNIRETLSAAAVIGREFDLGVLRAMSGLAAEELIDRLTAAGAAQVVEAGLGRWAFVHGLLRETLYDAIRPSERVALHRRAGEAIEDLCRDEPRERLPELAHHFFEAARSGEGAKAHHWCVRAGDAAMTMLAFEEAALQYGRALEALAVSPPIDERQRFELLARLGDARFRLGDFPQALEMYRRALKSARAVGSPELLATAAIGYAGLPEAMRDDTRVSVLEEARAAMPADDSPLRARLLLALAGARMVTPDRPQLSAEGLAMARRVGDAATLRAALWEWHLLHHEPDQVEEALAAADELLRLSEQAGDRERVQMARQWRVSDLFEAGDTEGARDELERAAADASELRLPFLVWGSTFAQAALALLEGQIEEAERLAQEALTVGERSEYADVEEVFATQLWLVRREQGRFEEMADTARRAAIRSDEWTLPLRRAQLAIALAEVGQPEEARHELEQSVGPLLDHWGLLRLVGPALVAETSWLIDETRWAEQAYDTLLRWTGRHVVVRVTNCSLGSSDRYLAHLAALLRRFEEAETHFGRAHAHHEELGARAWLAHGHLDHSRMLRRRAAPGDASRARDLLVLAQEEFRSLGMAAYERRAAELISDGGRGLSSSGVPERASLTLEGEFWAVEYGGAQARLRDSKGLRYLARLLASPGQELHALDLVTGEGRGRVVAPAAARDAGLEVAGDDAGVMLDARAKAEYRRRLTELEEDIEEAAAYHDAGRLDRAQQERDFLIAELSAAVGLGGRDRKAASDAERARQSVTRAIKGAVERLAEAHPSLGEHLRTTVRTGTYSSYTPDPRAPVTWQT